MKIEDVKDTKDLWKYERERAKENPKHSNNKLLIVTTILNVITIIILLIKLFN